MKLLGMVYSEDELIKMNENEVSVWLIFSACIKRYLGEMKFDEGDKMLITKHTKKMKDDKKWFQKQNMGEFRSYWNSKQHTKYLFHYHFVKNSISIKLQSEKENVLKVNGKFSFNEQLTDHMKNVIKQCRSYYNIKKIKLKNKIAGSTIAKFKNFQITCDDIYDRLFVQQWLNHNIIDAFSAVLQEQSQHKIILSSYFAQH